MFPETAEPATEPSIPMLERKIAEEGKPLVVEPFHGEHPLPLHQNIEHYDRKYLKEQFLAALPDGTWIEREEATRAFARQLGYKRTGSTIRDTAASLINGLLREKRLEREGTRIRRMT